MPQLVEMDRHVSLFEQMEEEQVGSVILINTFTVEPEEADRLQEAWASDAAFMKQQPGFISTQLHRGIGGVRCSSTTRCRSRSRTSSGPCAPNN
jgi:Antibiotic biosynthesis monooxygenase